LTVAVSEPAAGTTPFLISGDGVTTGLKAMVEANSGGSPAPASIGKRNAGMLGCGSSVMATAGGADYKLSVI
jgi:hypothetical protein